MAASFAPHKLRTVQLVPATAYDGGGNLALDLMQENTRRLLEAGIRVFIPCAGSSEFHALRADEIAAVVRATREVVGDQACVMAPVGLQLHHALDVGRQCLDAGADCLLVMPLDFPFLCDSGARDYYHVILEQLAAPTLFYKKAEVPSDNLLLELADHPKVVGVKYAVNDLDAFTRVVNNDDGRIDWFCGSAERFAPFFMLAGATGYTSGAGNLCPRLTLAMHAACAAGNWPRAMRLLQLIRPIEEFRARAGSSYNISFLKYAMTHVGLDFGDVRPPYRRLTEAEKREIDAIVAPILEAEAELARAPVAVS